MARMPIDRPFQFQSPPVGPPLGASQEEMLAALLEEAKAFKGEPLDSVLKQRVWVLLQSYWDRGLRPICSRCTEELGEEEPAVSFAVDWELEGFRVIALCEEHGGRPQALAQKGVVMDPGIKNPDEQRRIIQEVNAEADRQRMRNPKGPRA